MNKVLLKLKHIFRPIYIPYFAQKNKAEQKANYKKNFAVVTEKIKNSTNKTPKIAFVINFSSAWTSFQSVYCEAKRLGLPTKIVCAERKDDHDMTEDCYFPLKEKYGEDVERAFLDESKNTFNLKDFNPDYVFYTRPYNLTYPDYLSSHKVSEYARVCIVPYGYAVTTNIEIFAVAINYGFYGDMYIAFNTGKKEKRFLKRMFRSDFSRYHFSELKGYPRFDLINKGKAINKKDTTIMWAPRFVRDSEDPTSVSSFLPYCEKVLERISKAKENWIFRPHPHLFSKGDDNYLWQKYTGEDYPTRLSKFSNAVYDRSGNYIDSINKTDIILSDFSGLLIEYALTGKPIIYYGNKKAINTKGLYKCFYVSESWEQTEKILNDLKNGIDPKKEYRENFVKNFLRGNEHAGQKIIQTIIDDYNKTKRKI